MLERLLGNQRVKEVLRRMLAARRVPGALLFAGEPGIGKKLFAIELAKALNCRSPWGSDGCGRCPSCMRTNHFTFPAEDDRDANRRIIWSDHPDVGMVRPYGRFLVVDQIREVEREANFRPYEGVARVFLIDDAHRLNESASNALLKTLEEPPPTSHLVLITQRPAALLPTIRSRCQVLRFAPLPVAEIEEHLAKDSRRTAADAHLLAQIARGSIGRAMKTDVRNYRSMRQGMMEVLDALAVTDNRTVLLRATEDLTDAKNKDTYETRMDLLETLIRDLLVVAAGDTRQLLVNDDLRPTLESMHERVDSRRAGRWLSQIEAMRDQLSVNINRKAATDALFLTMLE
jgi:DNA polymerase-3 subunit delta'